MALISEEDIERIKPYLHSMMSAHRLDHSERVGREAVRLAGLYALDEVRAYAAGLFHDIARELHAPHILDFARHYRFAAGAGIDDWEEAHPLMLHGAAGAWLLSTMLGVDDPPVLEAIEHHTLGHPEMGELAALVYCADFLEPGRHFDNRPWRQLVPEVPLMELAAKIAADSCRYNQKNDRLCYPPQLELAALFPGWSEDCDEKK